MRCAFVIAALLYAYPSLLAQKPAIDSSTYRNWPLAGGGRISHDGKYVTYRVDTNQYQGYSILTSVQRDWKVTGPLFLFTSDGRYAYFMGSDDTLCKVVLGGDIVERIPGVVSWSLAQEGATQWLIYRKKGENGEEQVLQNMSTGMVKIYPDTTDCQFSDDGKILLVQSGSGVNGNNVYELRWEDLSDDHVVSIYKGEKASEIHFDTLNHQLSFSSQKIAVKKVIKSYWYYKVGLDSARRLISDVNLGGTQKDLQLGAIVRFSKEGDRLFFNLSEKPIDLPKALPDALPLEVWSYQDVKLQSYQAQELKANSPKSYLAVLTIADRRVIRLQKENEPEMQLFPVGGMADEYAIAKYWTDKDPDEMTWNPKEGEAYLVSTRDGSRKSVTEMKAGGLGCCNISPEGRYLVFYNDSAKGWFSYSTPSGIIRNITKAIPATYSREIDITNHDIFSGFEIVGWFAGDSAVLVWDQYDIWKVDLAGMRLPVNLTGGYGRKHHISFRLGAFNFTPVVSANEGLMLYAFNQASKENGFYWLTIGRKGDPELLTMGPYIYHYLNSDLDIHGRIPTKAKDAQAWLVYRKSARESGNYFWTSDFKTFLPVSDVHPEKDWNWVTTELIDWKTPDGKKSQGILYKPENFDLAKKYPVIFYYYEQLSDRLNDCLEPGLSDGRLNILWYVSNGYLVFSPDIYYTIGEMGESALKYVESAARHLAKMAWVDSSRMGLQGLSHGAIETNYIVTHSHLFAAACSSSGISDFISAYGSIDREGGSLQSFYETGQMRMGATLWQRPDLYIKNSAIFKANTATTPLLLMHTPKDGTCPFTNIEEFFVALRRFKKPVWMLVYDEGNHGVWGRSAVDFTIRMQQFFDHYLKGAPMPKWMAEGIPARMQGIETRLELEDDKTLSNKKNQTSENK